MRFTGTFRAPRLNEAKYRKILHEHLTDVLPDATVQWLGTVLPNIPVWSGASAATFLPLARKVAYENLPTSNNYGLRHAEGDFDPGRSDPNRYVFTYSTTLAHLIWNEFHNANIDPDPTKWPPPAVLKKPGPYEFQKLGQEAFEKFAAGVSLPDPFVALRTRQIRVG